MFISLSWERSRLRPRPSPAPSTRRASLFVRHLEDGVGALGTLVTRAAVAAIAAAVAALAVAVVAFAAVAASPPAVVPAAATAVGPLRARGRARRFRLVVRSVRAPPSGRASGGVPSAPPSAPATRSAGPRSRTLHAFLDRFALGRRSLDRLLVRFDLLVRVRHV